MNNIRNIHAPTMNAATILERHIDRGLASARHLFDYAETFQPRDQVVRAGKLLFQAGSQRDGVSVHLGSAPEPVNVHKHALQQLAGKAGVPSAYLAELSHAEEPWKRELAAHALNEHYHHDASKYLVRSVPTFKDGPLEVRGFLSDRYRRLDSRPLLMAFAEACEAIGAKPVDGTVSNTRLAIKAIIPQVFEPVPGEAIAFGLEWGNSDFGSAKHTVRVFMLRLWCLNGATMENALSEVHLGRQLTDDVEFSQKTYALDTRTSVSALHDVVRGLLVPAKLQKHVEVIQAADAAKVDWKGVNGVLSRKLTKAELLKAKDAFEGPDVVNLPAGPSMWRASNAISWLAGSTEDPDRKLDLQRLAGELVNGKIDRAEREAD